MSNAQSIKFMSGMGKYRKRIAIVAVQINLETTGISYQKWGGPQQAKAGDWLVNSGGEAYTIDADSFAATYEVTSPGQYKKTAPTWARRATEAGEVATKEGVSQYAAGDWLASNDVDGNDCYVIPAEVFAETFEPYDEA